MSFLTKYACHRLFWSLSVVLLSSLWLSQCSKSEGSESGGTKEATIVDPPEPPGPPEPPEPLTDLVLENLSVTPATFDFNSRITLSVDVRNRTNKPIPADISYYRSINDKITHRDTLLDGVLFSSIGANGTKRDTTPRRDRSIPGTYYYGACLTKVTHCTSGIEVVVNSPTVIGNADPLYSAQWHLHNENDVDINAPEAWQIIEGSSQVLSQVLIAVVDDGVIISHPDLSANHKDGYSYNYVSKGNDPHEPANKGASEHGTAVVGLIVAAKDNGLGVIGVSPDSKFFGLNLLESLKGNYVDAMLRHKLETAVSNNSWGSTPIGTFVPTPSSWKAAIDEGIQTGYDGKGIFYVLSAGNNHLIKGLRANNSNYRARTKYHGVTTVCAVDYNGSRATYSEMGANLWICGLSRDGIGSTGLVTTDIPGEMGYNPTDYTDTFSGTSGSAPIVSGVAALMRSINPRLGWRDVRLIMAATARKIEPSHTGWFDGANSYTGSEYSETPYHHNHQYGFGLVDAEAAVKKAHNWNNVGPMVKAEGYSVIIPKDEQNIPDNQPSGITSILTVAELNPTLDFIEYLEITIKLSGEYYGNLQISLTSPTHTTSILAETHLCFNKSKVLIICSFTTPTEVEFGSARHLGETPNGNWTLKIADLLAESTHQVTEWGIRFYGHKKP